MDTTLYVMIAIWGLIVTAFVALMVYRGHLTQYETDQLFLSEAAPSTTHQENDAIIRRVNHLQPFVKLVGGACVLMTILIIGVWIAQMVASSRL
jgi:glycerol uptake facilitator-like aquaporin